MTPPATGRSASPRLWVAAATFSAIVSGCGGDGGSDPTPPQTTLQSVSVQVSTSGEDLDTDGYTLHLGSRTEAVGANGSARFDDIQPGSHQLRITGVADNCEVDGGDTRTVTVGTDNGVQASFSVTCERDFDDGYQTVACSDLSLAAASGLPLDFVEIGRLPAVIEEPTWGRVTWEGGDETTISRVEVVDEGSSRALVPLHPAGALESGPVSIRFTDGERACEPVELTIEALPAAPGATATLLDRVEIMLRDQAATFGVTLEELLAEDPELLPPYLAMLALGWEVLAGPDHANSVTARIGELTESARAELDAVVARAGLAGNGVAGQPVPSQSLTPKLACQEFELGDIDLLDDCLSAAIDAHERSVELRDASASDRQSDLAALARDPLIGPPLRGILLVGDLALFGAFHLLPSSVEVTEIKRTGTLLEDDPETHDVTSVKVSAASLGFELSGDVLPMLRRLFVPQLWALYQSAGFDGGDIASQTADIVFTEIYFALLQGQDVRTWEAEVFGPVELLDATWIADGRVEAKTSGPSIEVVPPLGYRGTDVGPSTLEIHAEFDLAPRMFSTEIVVDMIDVDLQPGPEVWMKPEEVREFEVVVKKSVAPDQVGLFEDALLQGEAFLQVQGDSSHPVLYKAPEEPKYDSDDRLIARTTSTLGSRNRPNPPPRSDTTTIHFANVIIDPRSACVSPGETETFTAEVKGEDQSESDVEWSVEGGDAFGEIDDDGVYRAPDVAPQPATATIKATLGSTGIDDEVQVTIGGCTCGFTVTVDGATLVAEAGDQASFTSWPPENGGDHQLVTVHVYDASADRETMFVPQSTEPGPAGFPSGPGSYEAEGGGGVGYGGFYGSYDNAGTLLIDEYVKERTLKGSFFGIVEDQLEDRSFELDATFQITIPPDGGPLGIRYYCTVDGG